MPWRVRRSHSRCAKVGTLGWALNRYRKSSAGAGLSAATRRQRENIYCAVSKTAGSIPLRKITSETIRAGRERRATRPHGSNNFLKAMRGFFARAVEDKLVAADPAKAVKCSQDLTTPMAFTHNRKTSLIASRLTSRWERGND
jgi:hypothetical protein